MYFAVFKSGFAITARSPSVDSYKIASLRSYSAGSGGAHSFLEVKGLNWPTKNLQFGSVSDSFFFTVFLKAHFV